MLANRTTDGRQIANPSKFPDGFKAVADFIHSLGLKSGLYTAKGPNTCAGFAASCDHEAQDALQWASWGIDYVKDDSVRINRARLQARTNLHFACLSLFSASSSYSFAAPSLSRTIASHSRLSLSLTRTRSRRSAPPAATRLMTSCTRACGRRSRRPAATWCSQSRAILTMRAFSRHLRRALRPACTTSCMYGALSAPPAQRRACSPRERALFLVPIRTNYCCTPARPPRVATLSPRAPRLALHAD